MKISGEFKAAIDRHIQSIIIDPLTNELYPAEKINKIDRRIKAEQFFSSYFTPARIAKTMLSEIGGPSQAEVFVEWLENEIDIRIPIMALAFTCRHKAGFTMRVSRELLEKRPPSSYMAINGLQYKLKHDFDYESYVPATISQISDIENMGYQIVESGLSRDDAIYITAYISSRKKTNRPAGYLYYLEKAI